MEARKLIEKYNIPVPRYTSYPTVPQWKLSEPTQDQWKNLVQEAFEQAHNKNGISMYMHLPFCESLCTYCGCTTRITKNHSVEIPYIETLLKEWGLYIQLTDHHKITLKELHLGGGTPTFFSASNLNYLLSSLFKTVDISDNASFSFEAHPTHTSNEQLQTLFSLGFKRLSYGIQDFDPIVQTAINRFQTIEQVTKATEAARSTGYSSINFDLVYGLPMQTLASIQETIALVQTLRPDRIAFYSYAHVPWLKPGQRKFTDADVPVGAEKQRLYEVGKAMLLEAGYIEVGMDHFALAHDSLFVAQQNQRLHRNFMGYTEQDTDVLIGLGASAISDLGGAYAQNVKTVEAYRAALLQENWAIERGIVLTALDRYVKQRILDLICNFETQIDAHFFPELQWRFIVESLYKMEADGLLIFNGSTIRVLEAGQKWVRNICAVLDQYLLSKTKENPVFSTSV